MGRPLAVWLVLAAAALVAQCREPAPGAECEPGRIYCEGERARRCESNGRSYEETECDAVGAVCHPGLGCVACHPRGLACDGDDVVICSEDGQAQELVTPCDVASGLVCYLGNCVDACEKVRLDRSYVGCEYWPVDLDNARISSTENAASQPFAVVLSNPSALTAHVVVERNLAAPGWPLDLEVVSELDVPPEGLRVATMPWAEVDGSPPGTYDQGTHSALTSHAFRVRSNVPLVAYQFNPLENANVFSNDASLLVPKSALDLEYRVLGWPQTIADTDDPATDFHRSLRAFITVVGTEPGTDVEVTVAADVLGAPGIPALAAGETGRFHLGPFDVLNLETDGYLADLTGSVVRADRPVAVFSGSEASDVPYVADLSLRRCCADHLEHQLFPLSSAGTRFVAARTPARTPRVVEAGGEVSIVDEPEYFRILATENETLVVTTLPPPDDRLQLDAGEFATLRAFCDFTIQSSAPVFVGQFPVSTMVVGIPLDVPGGDPTFILLPPVEQWRATNVFLTPDKYAFDFIVVVAPRDTSVLLDHEPLPGSCEITDAACGGLPESSPYVIYKCQLSFPVIHPALPPPGDLEPGVQNDGYHVLTATRPVGLIVFGFDKHVSYGYAGGLDLRRINVK